MPLLQIQTSSKAPGGSELLRALSAELARELGRPESYVMVSFENDAQLLFGLWGYDGGTFA